MSNRNDLVWRILRSLDVVDARRSVPLDRGMNLDALQVALDAAKAARYSGNDSYNNNLAYMGALVIRAMEDSTNE